MLRWKPFLLESNRHYYGHIICQRKLQRKTVYSKSMVRQRQSQGQRERPITNFVNAWIRSSLERMNSTEAWTLRPRAGVSFKGTILGITLYGVLQDLVRRVLACFARSRRDRKQIRSVLAPSQNKGQQIRTDVFIWSWRRFLYWDLTS